MGLRINISRNQFALLIVIISIALTVRYQEDLLGVFSPYFPESQQNIAGKEALLSAGFKEATLAGQGPGACYIIEPVYAQLRCNRIPLGIGGTQDALKLGPGLIEPEGTVSKEIITELDDWEIPDLGLSLGTSVEGLGHKIDWKTLSRERFNIEKVEIATPTNDIRIVIEYESGAAELWFGCLSTGTADYCGETQIYDTVESVYIFGIEASLFGTGIGSSPAFGPWFRPYRINDWRLDLTATDEYLSFSIPGALDHTRIDSQGCEVLDKAGLLHAISQKIDDPSSPWSFDTQIPDLADMEEILARANREIISQGGAVTEAQDNARLNTLFNTIFSNDESSGEGPLLDYPQIGNLRRDGDAINWPYLYRNTGIVGDVTPTYYKGEPVLCDWVNKRLVGFIEVPQTEGMEAVDVCYAYPATNVKDGRNDPRFSCSQTFCDDQWAHLGFGTWDPAEFTCVKTGTEVEQQGCRGSGDCTPIFTQHYPTGAGFDGACLAVSSECVPSDDAPAGFIGFCSRIEESLPVCCPGEITATGQVCNLDGTSFVDPVFPRSACPAGQCCIGDLQYLDSGSAADEYGCLDTGKICCADVTKGETRSNCANTCENEFSEEGFFDRLMKQFIRLLKGELGIGEDTDLSKIITIVLIILAVIAGLLILFVLINAISGIVGALGGGAGLFGAVQGGAKGAGKTINTKGTGGGIQSTGRGPDININLNLGGKK